LPNTIQKLYELGQSVWCDNISRAMVDSGTLMRMIDGGIVGVTSNPTIFMKAITGGTDYDALFGRLISGGAADMEVYEGLVLPDIRDGADALRPVYDRTGGADGFISLEVNPKLAYRKDETVAEARRLWATVDRPNLMIKVPATEQGLPAVEVLIGEGINVNVTLIFSIAMYRKVMQAYLNGLKKREVGGGDLSRAASVASFFVSRLDTAVDRLLDEKTATPELSDLKGKAAVANTKLAYAAFKEVFQGGGEFASLKGKGARVQRPLWASTSTKNPAYPDTLYVDPLIGPETVNTMPPATIEVTLDHGVAALTIEAGLDEARSTFDRLRDAGIYIDAVTDKLLTDGVDLFARSFDDLLADIAHKRERLTGV